MIQRAELKANAKAQIKGNIGIFFLCAIVMSLINSTGIGALFVPAISVGICLMYIELSRGVKPSVGDMFKRSGTFGKALWLAIITNFFIMMWSFLLYVPGIIKAISYSMGQFILAENPEYTARQALNESKRIMEGHKMDFFVMMLSFIGWSILASFTFGLLYIWLFPYMIATVTNFYLAIKDGGARV